MDQIFGGLDIIREVWLIFLGVKMVFLGKEC